MTVDPDIGSMAVADLLAAIASDEPAPGAGAAGAIALAFGLACARKALRITGRHHPADTLLPAAESRLAGLIREALRRGREDARSFAALIAATRMPHDDARQTAARETAIVDAEAAVRSNTTRLIALCDRAAAEVDGAAGRVDAVMAGDIAAARGLIAAARAIHAANLREGDRPSS